MNGYEFDRQDPANKTWSYVLSRGLRPSLTDLQSRLRATIEHQFDRVCPLDADKTSTVVSVASLAREVGGALNCLVVFGERFASSQRNIDNAIKYARDAAVTAEVLKFIPAFMQE
ncbi:MAG: hypothetical protein Q9162_002450 [Coniocarpon cinnabarinum]